MFSIGYLEKLRGELAKKKAGFTKESHYHLMEGTSYEQASVYVRFIPEHRAAALGGYEKEDCFLTKEEKTRDYLFDFDMSYTDEFY